MKEAMYRDHARCYDLIYSFKDYKAEADEIRKVIAKYKRSKGKNLLDVGCGTGKHLEQFKEYTLAGADPNTGILSIAKKRLPRAQFYAQDMSKLHLRRQFDVIITMFSAIGYVRTHSGLNATMKGFADHLAPGGIVIIEPWLTKEVYRAGWPHMTTYDGKEIKIARLVVSKVKGEFSVMDMNFVVAERGKDVVRFNDLHIMRMTPLDDLLQMMRDAGLDARLVKNKMFGRGLLVGVKPSA